MNEQKEIIGLMNGKIQFTKKSLFHLSKILIEYPYFQVGHLLQTLNLLQLRDSYFIFDLRKTSVYMQDREQLLFKVENGFFKPGLIRELDMKKETLTLDSSFDIIDTFLSDIVNEPEIKESETAALHISPASPTSPISPASPASPIYTLPEEPENTETPPFKYQDTIEKFLEEDAISPVKIKVDKKEETEEIEIPEFLTEQANSESFFSETLAKIYIKKKNYVKALEILQKINLQHPEKNRYFADQIRFLEKLIINTNNKK